MVDTAPLRCLQPDPAARREATLTVQAPRPDVTDIDGAPAVSRAALKAKVDEARAAIVRKNGTITRVLDEQQRCIEGGTTPAASPKPESNRVS